MRRLTLFTFSWRITMVLFVVALLPLTASADHNGLHPTPCNEPGIVGGGVLGNSPGPIGPPNSFGWDVGSGQCNGSFSVVSETFPAGIMELGLRIEQRRVGQVAPTGPNEYEVSIGPDTTAPVAINRAWWNFQPSIAYQGNIATLNALTLTINTDVGPNLPSLPVFDLIFLRPFIDDRNNQPNSTIGFSDLYQVSQNPEFGWFAPTSDTDANPTGAFDYGAPGAWRFTLTAVEGVDVAKVTICVHTPGEVCEGAVVVEIDIKPGSDPNAINCNNEKEVIPVAILTTSVADGDAQDFDALTVDHTTVIFQGAMETHTNKKTNEPRRHEEDVDGDGDLDLVLHFRLGETDLTCESREATLEGETFSGDAIESDPGSGILKGG